MVALNEKTSIEFQKSVQSAELSPLAFESSTADLEDLRQLFIVI